MLKAREVLDDCRLAHQMLERAEDADEARVLWVSAVALARAVGHVLHKVDAAADPRVAAAVARQFASWKKHRERNAIFWDFIEQERNQVLKQYEIGYTPEIQGLVIDGMVFTAPECIYLPLVDGRYADEDCRDVLLEAIRWWDKRLRTIERMVRWRCTPNKGIEQNARR